MFKISPDEALKVVQELYEKKMVTYPRTDARVLSTAVAKEIRKNISGLSGYSPMRAFVQEILQGRQLAEPGKNQVCQRQTDHRPLCDRSYGPGTGQLKTAYTLAGKGLSGDLPPFFKYFYPPAVYQKYTLELERKKEHFFAGFKVLSEPGYLKVADVNLAKNQGLKRPLRTRKRRIPIKIIQNPQKLTEQNCYRCLQI